MAAIGHRMTATNFTFAALAVIIGALISAAHLDKRIVGATLLAVVPQLAKSGLLIWLGEYERSQRAGRHIARVELKINRLLDTEALTWESGLKSTSAHMGYPYRAVLTLLLGTGYCSVVLGLTFLGMFLHDRAPCPRALWWTLWGLAAVAAIAAEARFLVRFRRLWTVAKTGIAR